MSTGWIIAIIVIAVIVIWYVMTYNRLVAMRTHVQESWSQIDVQLTRRNDLIPNLLATVKGYSKYEQGVFDKITKLRSELAGVPEENHQEKMAVANQLTGALHSLVAVAENYPDLKASTEYSKLMEELTNTENKIAYSRQLYNSTAAALNAKIQQFPSKIVASLGHFTAIDYLKAPEKAQEVPKISFDD